MKTIAAKSFGIDSQAILTGYFEQSRCQLHPELTRPATNA